jgi:hypothetical protein
LLGLVYFFVGGWSFHRSEFAIFCVRGARMRQEIQPVFDAGVENGADKKRRYLNSNLRWLVPIDIGVVQVNRRLNAGLQS